MFVVITWQDNDLFILTHKFECLLEGLLFCTILNTVAGQ
jgi:hypothetical protein